MLTKKTTKKGTTSRKNISKSPKTKKSTKKVAVSAKKRGKVASKVRFSTQDRDKQKKLLWQFVAGRKERATFEQITVKLQKKYPSLQEHSVRYVIDGLIAKKHIRPIRVSGQRALRYATGKAPL